MDEPEFREIVAEFIPALHEKINSMAALLEAADFRMLAREAHWLKGSGGTVGFAEFYQPAMELETAARAGNERTCRQKITHIRDLCKAIELPDSAETTIP
jgi:HPt (histidine-containing phosphotransfer) domain-containing protein